MIEQATIDFLTELLGSNRVSTLEADLTAHSQDESTEPPHPPDVVVWPENAQEISAILSYANSHRIPVVPWSGGSSLAGNPIPVKGGIILALYRLNRVLELREEDVQVVVQPGVVCDDLNAYLARYGLFYPPEPASHDVATIGGMVANHSSGMHAATYGGIREQVLDLEVVLPDGRIIHTGRPVLKSASGYDLASLFTGSEGTLGVVTEITLRLALVPEKIAAVATFPTMEAAAQAIYETIRFGPLPAALELMDPEIVRLVNQYRELELEEVPTLVMEFHGTPDGIAQEVALIRETCELAGATSFRTADNPTDSARLWEGRSEAHNACKYLNPDYNVQIGDIVVPISRYTETVLKAYKLAEELGTRIASFGHAADGNLHVERFWRKDDPEEQARAEEFNSRLIEWTLSVGGTCTGEHGVGLGKRRFMRQEHGEALEVMKAIKNLFDPNGIMNPGKIFPDEGED